MLDQSRANWIAEHIARTVSRCSVLLNWQTLESALPDMTMALVISVIPTNIARHPPLHEWTQGRISSRLHNQMEMMRYKVHAKHATGNLDFAVASKSREKTAAPPFPRFRTWQACPGNLSTWNPRHESVWYVACPLL